jgi:hypothetical protein
MVGTVRASGIRARGLKAASLLLLLAAGGAAAGPVGLGPRIEGLVAQPEEDRVIVSFQLAGAPTDEDLERLLSGIPVTYRHRVEVVAPRGVRLWPARLLGRATLETTARYDSLTQRYRLERQLEVKGVREPVEELGDSASEEKVRAWLADVQELVVPLVQSDIDAERIRVRVKSTIGRHYVLLLFPAKQTLSAEWRPAERAEGP